jgi:hypothetical protein
MNLVSPPKQKPLASRFFEQTSKDGFVFDMGAGGNSDGAES